MTLSRPSFPAPPPSFAAPPGPSFTASPDPDPDPDLRLAPFPRPLGTDAPPTCEVPHFAPVRVRGGGRQLRRLLRHRRRAVAAGLALTAAALVAAGPREAAEIRHSERPRGHPVADPLRQRRAVEWVSAPVRIADAGTVRLLRAGDRVDVIAAEESAAGGDAHVVARGARVTKVPEPLEVVDGGGALVVLSVPRATAARLAGASVTARLAVTMC